MPVIVKHVGGDFAVRTFAGNDENHRANVFSIIFLLYVLSYRRHAEAAEKSSGRCAYLGDIMYDCFRGIGAILSPAFVITIFMKCRCKPAQASTPIPNFVASYSR